MALRAGMLSIVKWMGEAGAGRSKDVSLHHHRGVRTTAALESAMIGVVRHFWQRRTDRSRVRARPPTPVDQAFRKRRSMIRPGSARSAISMKRPHSGNRCGSDPLWMPSKAAWTGCVRSYPCRVSLRS